MKREFFLIALVILVTTLAITARAADPQKKRKNSAKPTPSKSTPLPTIWVRVRFTNGREVTGRLFDINLKTLSVDPGTGSIMTAPLQEVASMTLSETEPKVDPEFLKDADMAYRALLALSVATDGNISYKEYQPKVSEAKVAVEAFIAKYEQNSTQTELFRTMRAAARSYELVLPVWSLRLGQEQHKYVMQTSEQMRPILGMFPEIEQVSWKQNDRYPIEKVIPWVWVQAARLVEQSKKQLAQLR